MSEDQASIGTLDVHDSVDASADRHQTGETRASTHVAPGLVAVGRPAVWKRSVHIYALYGMSIVQTILLVTAKNPSFWVVHRSNTVDVAAFLATVLIFIPAVLIAIPYLLGRVNATLGWVVHLVILGGLAALLLVDLFGNILGADTGGVRILTLSLAIAMLLIVGYCRLRIVGDLMLAIVVAPVVVTTLFILSLPPLGANEAPSVALGVVEHNPVVVVVLDEFSLPVLKDADGSIDASRFPNFARLAEMSTWYPMATSAHDGTLFAVPAILTGNRPEAEPLPIASNHPVNLFTALADTHEMVVVEDATRLCPDRLCAATTDEPFVARRLWTVMQDSSVVYLNSIVPHDFLEVLRVPSLGIRWRNFLTADDPVEVKTDVGPLERKLSDLSGNERRSASIGAFLDRIDGTESPLYFFHVDLPHAPYTMLPDGRWYPSQSVSDSDQVTWEGDEFWRQQALAKYSAHVGYADLVVGELLDQLQRVGILDESLLVVVSDHGVSFKATEPRRLVTPGNFVELASVPLFVKYPHQDTGVVDMRNAETIDVFPTIIDALGGSVESDGDSLLGDVWDDSKLMGSREGPTVSMDLKEYERRVRITQDEIAKMILAGHGHAGLISGIGPLPELAGRPIGDLQLVTLSGDVVVWGTDGSNVIDTGMYPPALVIAEVSTDDEMPTMFALVTDGAIVGTATPFETTRHTAKVRFFVDPQPIVDADGVVEVMGIVAQDDGTYRLFRFD